MEDGQTWEEYEAQYNATRAAALDALTPRWGVKGHRGHNTHDGVAYRFDLTFGRLAGCGRVVATVEDEGRGGSPLIYWTDGRDSAFERAFMDEAHALFGDGWVIDSMVDIILTSHGK